MKVYNKKQQHSRSTKKPTVRVTEHGAFALNKSARKMVGLEDWAGAEILCDEAGYWYIAKSNSEYALTINKTLQVYNRLAADDLLRQIDQVGNGSVVFQLARDPQTITGGRTAWAFIMASAQPTRMGPVAEDCAI